MNLCVLVQLIVCYLNWRISKLNKIDNLFPPYTGTSYDENDLEFLFKEKNITIKKSSPNY